MIKKCTALVLFFICQLAFAEYTTNYDSENFIIRVKVNCEEGNVDCDKVSFTMTRKKDKKVLQLSGKTMNNPSTHDFQGYEFRDGDTSYTIYDEQSTLEASKGNKLLFSEKLKVIDNNS
jgi:hypothetical protein